MNYKTLVVSVFVRNDYPELICVKTCRQTAIESALKGGKHLQCQWFPS